MAYDAGVREAARELYVIEGLTFDEVSARVGIHTATLKRWSTEEGNWRKRRGDLQTDLDDIEQLTVRLRKRLLDQALSSLDPQMVYAAVRLEGASKRGQVSADEPDPMDRPRCFLEDLQFVAETIKELDPEGFKIFARNYDVIVARGKEKFQGLTQ